MADTPLEFRKLCRSCSLDSIRKLKYGNYPVENKEKIVEELREVLKKPDENETELLNYHG